MKGKQKGKKNRQDKLVTVYGELHEAGKKKVLQEHRFTTLINANWTRNRSIKYFLSDKCRCNGAAGKNTVISVRPLSWNNQTVSIFVPNTSTAGLETFWYFGAVREILCG